MIAAPQIPGVNLESERCCLISRRAALLWSSPSWWPDGKPGPEDARFMGFGWHEFIHHDDLDLVKQGFAELNPRTVVFRCLLPAFGHYAKFTHYKIPYGENWLTIGKSEIVSVLLPTMPCDFYLDENTGTDGHKG